MQISSNYHFNLPEDVDPLLVSKLSENFGKIDTLIKGMSDRQDGFETGAQLAYGSYVGTQSGSFATTTTLTFPFNPLLVVVSRCGLDSNGTIMHGGGDVWLRGVPYGGTGITPTNQGVPITWGENQITYQGLNTVNYTYLYAAIG